MSNWNSNNFYSDQEHQQFNEYEHYRYFSDNSQMNSFNYFSDYYNLPCNGSNQNFLKFENTVNNLTDGPFVQAGTSTSVNQFPRYIDVSHSNLTPTAAEFKPRNLNLSTTDDTVNNGTKKKIEQHQNKKINYNKPNQRYNKFHKKVFFKEDEGIIAVEHENLKDSKKYKEGAMNKIKLLSIKNQRDKSKYQIDNYELSQNNREFQENNGSRHKNSKNNYYGNDRPSIDYKKKWNKNSYKYNRKYDERYQNCMKENWRQLDFNEVDKEKKSKKHGHQLEIKCAASQRERLQEMLERLQLECMVCCEKLRHLDSVWSCKQCYNILHLDCVKKWANTSKMETGWRCPACQNIYPTIPKEYFCYCDKMANPKYEPGILPHSCGEICNRKGRICDHTCVLLCHPGPCPDCTVTILKACGCGSTKATVICSADVPITCQNICGKLLNCGIHTCPSTCHPGECPKCNMFVKQECYCGKLGRRVPCTSDVQGRKNFECDDICGKPLDCGNHKCELTCHSGSCPPCPISPDAISTCPCGQTKLTVERKSCFDPIPCCDKICNKPLACGQPSDPHRCPDKCHDGPCSSCPLTTMVKCRCGHMDKEIACKDLTSKADDARCQKKCTKTRLCCKHKCNQFCCIEIEHNCPLPCNRTLSCGLHRCEEDCHRGRCAPCWRSSFQELYCECGFSVIYPPVPCGTRPPSCNKPCSRSRSCGHDVFHNCHTGPCPPCTVLCKRWCHGKHEQRSTILCHQDDFSCGLLCGKDMPCGQHKCIQICHLGACQTPCVQPCRKIKQNCEHPCNQPCHVGECPDIPCKQAVRVTCQCGLRSSTRTCMDLTGEYQSITMTQLASKIAEIQKGQSIDITDIVGNQRKYGTPKTLECTEECRVAERNRRLAIGLQIRNPDLSAKLTPRYSDFMRGWAKKDARFCQHIHDKLTELVQKAKQSKQKSRSHSFETMNRDKRLFVHEYCQLFGCESEAYDAEPNRNVVATAYKDRSWLPSIGLLELIRRENGHRKVPVPVLENKNNTVTKRELVTLKLSSRPNPPPTPPGEYVDYFDDPPT